MPGPTVTVACKLPHGLILRLFDMVDHDEPQGGGGFKTVKRAQPRPEIVKLNGYLAKYQPDLPPAAIGSSYALTSGVDKEFFDAWLAQNKDHAAVANHLIFAHEKADSVQGKVREHKATRCGLEPIDRDRLPKGIASFKKEAA